MLAAEEITIDPDFERQPAVRSLSKWRCKPIYLLGILVIVGEVLFISWLVDYNLKQVPRSEVERIYRNAGNAVRNSFR